MSALGLLSHGPLCWGCSPHFSCLKLPIGRGVLFHGFVTLHSCSANQQLLSASAITGLAAWAGPSCAPQTHQACASGKDKAGRVTGPEVCEAVKARCQWPVRYRCLPEAGKGPKGRQKAHQLGQQAPLCYRVPEPSGKETGVREPTLEVQHLHPSPGDLPSNKTGPRSSSVGNPGFFRAQCQDVPNPSPRAPHIRAPKGGRAPSCR